MTEEQKQEIERLKAEYLLKPLNSPEEVSDWFVTYLGLDFPRTTVYPESTHSPIEAAWRIYQLLKTGESQEVPQVSMLASRDSFKTLIAAALEVLCMCHFRISVAHGAAIKSQSAKAVQYVNSFFRKIGPYLEANGWQKNSDSKEKIEWITDEGDDVYLRVLVATVQGMNSEHVPLLFIDEVDVVQDPRALQEAKMVPTVYNGYFPLTVYLSTRKFAGGLMEKTLDDTIRSGGEILRWNIIDITGKIPEESALKSKKKVKRYISCELPMRNISPDEFESLSEEEKKKFEPIMAYAGIAEHPMLSVMKNFLVDRPDSDTGGLYKPLRAVLNNFRQTDPEWANAQLLCNKPSSFGLVYPRFSKAQNSMGIDEAFESLTGEERKGCTLEYLVDFMHQMGIEFFAGVDWGFTDEGCIVVGAKVPNGDVWVMDMIAAPGLELEDMIKYAQELDSVYKIARWYCDSNRPDNIKAFNKPKNGLVGKAKGVKKTKDFVNDSITSVQSIIVDSSNNRRLKVIKHSATERIVDCFGTYKWKTDGKGDPIDGVPEHGKDGTSDVMDGLRYLVWGLIGSMSKIAFGVAGQKKKEQHNWKERVDKYNSSILKNRATELATSDKGKPKKSKKKGGIIFSV